jgi:hypothetical protein
VGSKHGIWSGVYGVFDRDEGWGHELTPDQTCKRLKDPTVSLTRERTLLDFRLDPK